MLTDSYISPPMCQRPNEGHGLLLTDADHNAAVTAFYSTFGDIMPTDIIVDLLGRE